MHTLLFRLRFTVRAVLLQLLDPAKLLRCVILATLPALMFYMAALAGLTANGFTVLEVLRDPAQTKNASSLISFLSNIGVGLWVSAAAIGLFNGATQSATGPQRRLLLLLGLFSAALAVDDFFLIHDRYISQRIVYAFYALCALTLLTVMFKTIAAIDGLAFVLAGSLLAASILTDLSQPMFPDAYMSLQITEEAFKFCGAATWLYFVCRVAACRHTAPAENAYRRQAHAPVQTAPVHSTGCCTAEPS